MAQAPKKTRTKRKSKGKQRFPAPPPERRCQAETAAGEQCPKWALKGRDLCGTHSKGNAKRWGKKGGEATSARWAEVRQAAERLPLQSPEHQQLYVIHLLDLEDRRAELQHKEPRMSMLINLLYLLDTITKKVPLSGQKFDVVYQPKLPEPDLEQWGQVPDMPPPPGPETDEQADDSVADYEGPEDGS